MQYNKADEIGIKQTPGTELKTVIYLLNGPTGSVTLQEKNTTLVPFFTCLGPVRIGAVGKGFVSQEMARLLPPQASPGLGCRDIVSRA